MKVLNKPIDVITWTKENQEFADNYNHQSLWLLFYKLVLNFLQQQHHLTRQ